MTEPRIAPPAAIAALHGTLGLLPDANDHRDPLIGRVIGDPMRKLVVEPEQIPWNGLQALVFKMEPLPRGAGDLDSELLIAAGVPPWIRVRFAGGPGGNAGDEDSAQLHAI